MIRYLYPFVSGLAVSVRKSEDCGTQLNGLNGFESNFVDLRIVAEAHAL